MPHGCRFLATLLVTAACAAVETGTWVPVGAGSDQTAWGLAEYGGQMHVSRYGNGPGHDELHRWDGSGWSAVSGALGGSRSLVPLGSDLYVHSDFNSLEAIAGERVARWDGAAWHDVDAAFFTGPVDEIFVYQGALHALARSNLGVSILARLSGSSWTTLALFNGQASRACADGSDLYVGGNFVGVAGVPAKAVARWNGSAWSALGPGLGSIPGPGSWGFVAVRAMAMHGGELVVGGHFDGTGDGGTVLNHLARWDGAAWHAYGSGFVISTPVSPPPCYVQSLASFRGRLVAGGGFTSVDGAPVSAIAAWDGSTWSSMASGMTDQHLPIVQALFARGDDLWAAGDFTGAGGQDARNVAYWHADVAGAPSVSFVAPAASGLALVDTPTAVVSGTASDDVAVTTVRYVAATLNGSTTASGVATGTGSWSFTIPVFAAATSVTVTAEDADGHTGVAVLRIARDSQAPAVAFTAPAPPTVAGSSVTVTGTATDDRSVVGVTYAATGATTAAGSAVGTNAWSFSLSGLAAGVTTVTVSAVDPSGNAGTATLAILRDVAAPVLAVATPSGGGVSITGSTTTVSGTAADDHHLDSVSWTLSGATTASGTAVGGASWSISLSGLAVGTSTLVVTARDDAGNTTAESVTIARSPPTPPVRASSGGGGGGGCGFGAGGALAAGFTVLVALSANRRKR